jgi:hypothetical protein
MKPEAGIILATAVIVSACTSLVAWEDNNDPGDGVGEG